MKMQRKHVFLKTALMGALCGTLMSWCAAQTKPIEIKYALWDANQRPSYQQCAVDFEKKNPTVKIKLIQMSWSDYWTGLTTGFVSGTAPDVFVNHLMRYPEFLKNNQLVDLAPLIKRDSVPTDIYADGLFDVWSHEGRQSGLPKDWDTTSLLVNLELAKKAGISEQDLNEATWNPKDGGSFGQMIAKLTMDEAGNNATSPAFDKTKVKHFGFQVMSDGGMMGQTEWSHFAHTNGFTYQDAPWSGKFHYDDPKLAETITWLRSLIQKGMMAPLTDIGTGRLGSAGGLFIAGKLAMLPQGSYMVGHYADKAKFPYAWVKLPVGPNGKRASLLNGVADSIWSGTKNKEEAWAWVKYLGSPACQNVVAEAAHVFPAIKGMAEKVIAVHQKRGIQTQSFLDMAKTQIFRVPIADNASQIHEIMTHAMQSILMGKSEAQPALKEANVKVNALAK